jgi:hypothetical protein
MRGTIPAVERGYTTPRRDKLVVKPGARVAIVGVPDEDQRLVIPVGQRRRARPPD